MTLKTDKTHAQYRVECAIAQLRHAYQQLVAETNQAWGHRQLRSFADGLIAPTIRTLEDLILPAGQDEE